MLRAHHHGDHVGASALAEQPLQTVVPVEEEGLLDDEPPRVPLARECLAHVIELHPFVEQRVADDEHVPAAGRLRSAGSRE